MVPFKENTFTFQSPEMARHLIGRLEPWQRLAIENVTLYQQNHWRYWRQCNSISKFTLPFSLLPGLRRIRIIIDLHIIDAERLSQASHGWCDWTDEKDQDKMIGAMVDFASGKLSKIEVAIVDMTWNAPAHWEVVTPTQLVAWASRIRVMMDRPLSQLNHSAGLGSIARYA